MAIQKDFIVKNGLIVGEDITVNGTTVIDTNAEIVTSQLKDSGVLAGNYGSSTQIPSITVDSKGRVTSVSNNSITVGDATITISGGTDLETGGDFTTNQSSNETITLNHSAVTRNNTTSSQTANYGDTIQVVDGITSSATGHITSVNIKTVTLPAAVIDTNTYVTSGSVIGTTLRLVNNDASQVDINVAALLDDTTNTISSGILNGNVITFTREDSTTFNVDVTNLYDDTNLPFINAGTIDAQNKLLTLTRNDASTIDIDVSELGGSGFSTRSTEDFTATEGQTVFTVTIPLVDIEIFYNGIKLDEEDYSFDSVLHTITLVQGANAGDNIEVINYGSAVGGEFSYNKYIYTVGTVSGDYDGNLNTFPAMYEGTQVEVFYNGLKLGSSEYTATNGTSITLTADAVVGDYIEVISMVTLTSNTYYNKSEIDNLGRGATQTSGTTAQVIDSFDVTEYRSGEYILTTTAFNGYHTCKMLVLYNDSLALNTIFGEMGENLGTFDTVMNGNILEVQFTPINPTAVVQFHKTLIPNIVASQSTSSLPTDLGVQDGVIDLLSGDGIIDLSI